MLIQIDCETKITHMAKKRSRNETIYIKTLLSKLYKMLVVLHIRFANCDSKYKPLNVKQIIQTNVLNI